MKYGNKFFLKPVSLMPLALLYANSLFAENAPQLKSTSYLTVKKSDPALAQKAQEEFFDRHEHGAILTPLHRLSENFFSKLWKVWEEPARSQAANATEEEKTRLAFERYGFVANPKNPKFPYGVGLNHKRQLAFNCLTCHVGQINGEPVIGIPNRTMSIRTFYEDLSRYFLIYRSGLKSSSTYFPENRGLINAIGSQIGLGLKFRNQNMEFTLSKGKAPMNGADPTVVAAGVNPLPWFGTKKKTHTASDAYLPITEDHAMIKTSVVPSITSRAQFIEKSKVTDYMFAYIRQIKSPNIEAFGGHINQDLAQYGRKVFVQNCQKCHGSYGPEWEYPNKLIPFDKVGTDPERVTNPIIYSIKLWLQDSWYGETNRDQWVLKDRGYLAPPLDGIWATAPYLHNASVPTLKDLFYPEQRPKIWKASLKEYDLENIGPKYETLSEIPENISIVERRGIYDTRDLAHSNQGHLYPSRLLPEEKTAVLEYLKTL